MEQLMFLTDEYGKTWNMQDYISQMVAKTPLLGKVFNEQQLWELACAKIDQENEDLYGVHFSEEDFEFSECESEPTPLSLKKITKYARLKNALLVFFSNKKVASFLMETALFSLFALAILICIVYNIPEKLLNLQIAFNKLWSKATETEPFLPLEVLLIFISTYSLIRYTSDEDCLTDLEEEEEEVI